jgi:Ca2+-binding EF-hand superfamily protein
LDKEEMKLFIDKIVQGSHYISDDMIKQVIKQFDTNNDGKIEFNGYSIV